MKKQFLSFLLLLILFESIFLVASFFPSNSLKVLAYYSSTSYFNFAGNITTFSPNFQNITNTYSGYVNVHVYVQTIANQSFLKVFRLLLNNTDFITVSNGLVTQSQNIFYGLAPSETLLYDALATPITTILNGDTSAVTYITEMYEGVAPPPPPPPLLLPPLYRFDIRITYLPEAVTYITLFCTTFQTTVSVINKGAETDATLKWQLLDASGNAMSSEQFAIFFKSQEQKNFTLTLSTPNMAGAYTLKVSVTKPVEVSSVKTFGITVFSIIPIVLAITSVVTLIVAVIVVKRRRKTT
jgi:hypothetical protein